MNVLDVLKAGHKRLDAARNCELSPDYSEGVIETVLEILCAETGRAMADLQEEPGLLEGLRNGIGLEVVSERLQWVKVGSTANYVYWSRISNAGNTIFNCTKPGEPAPNTNGGYHDLAALRTLKDDLKSELVLL